MEAKVRVRLMMDDKTRKAWVEVAVKSNAKPRSWLSQNVDADSPRLEYFVSVAGEGLAALCCERFGDRHNPPACAKAAVEALNEIMAKAKEHRKVLG